jgi:YVTN family beta-propeller protein
MADRNATIRTLARKPWALLSPMLFPLILAGCYRAPDCMSTEPGSLVGSQRYVLPVHQVLTPVGTQVELAGLRPQGLALSPNGSLLAAAGKTPEVVLLDPHSGTIRQRVILPSGKAQDPNTVSPRIADPNRLGQLGFTGLVFSPDGSRLYLSNVNGDIKIFEVAAQGQVKGSRSIVLPPANAPRRKPEIPAGLVLSHDGRRLYVALNLSNRLAEIEPETGKILRTWPVGVAPYDVVLAGGKAYVSNWGGRAPDANSITGPAGQGTKVRVDPVRYIASEGSVSVIRLDKEAPVTEIVVGLHSSALAATPDGRYVVVANAGSDNLSVIDARTDQVVETIWVKSSPADLFGASPNALAFDRAGDTLYVANGTQNAIAVVQFQPGSSKLLGLIPVGWFPGAVLYDAPRRQLIVANIKGVGSNLGLKPAHAGESNSLQYHGSLSLVPVPRAKDLPALTRQVLDNYRYPLLAETRLPARPDQPPRPIPERVGEPSVFEHVIYIIKENRTYDQVLGDVPEGNGHPSLCIFGANITPNQHKLVREFLLLDNTYCSGICSADGHQWTDSAFATDYMEKSFAGFPRSYPNGKTDDGVDALAYAPSGFLWDNAIAHGKSLRDYGEFVITKASWAVAGKRGQPRFLDCYRDFVDRTHQIKIISHPGIESLRPYVDEQTIGWNLDIPDIWRAARFIQDLRDCEQNGQFPDLTIMALPNDHTSGTKVNSPTPAAQVADNDLALGQIVEAITHSPFWPKACLFIIEDDPQNGWDHVSGFRTTAYVISPYTKRKTVIHTQYNQTSVVRSIELILGLPPMNQLDATATPMMDCFNDVPDLTPYVAVPANIPLDRMNPNPRRISDATLRQDALASDGLNLTEPDRCPEDVLNRILWHAMKGPREPYPQWAVTADLDD